MRKLAAVAFSLLIVMLANTAGAQALSWTEQPVPEATVPTGNLGAVSCASGSSCVAVGSYDAPTTVESVELAELWDGTTWSILNLPAAAPGASSYLDGVSCPTTTFCAAVGGETPLDGGSGADLLDVWNGTSWSVTSVGFSAGQFSGMAAVSCASPFSCVAVGDGSEVWNGSTWSSVPIAAPPGSEYSQLQAVSCSSGGDCTAVGYESPSSTQGLATRALAESWNGTAWTLHATPDPFGKDIVTLKGVSCAVANACVAVGSGARLTSTHGEVDDTTLSEVWNGTRWAIKSTPRQQSGTTYGLNAVSCSSASVCVAGGDSKLVELWNGTSWAIGSPAQNVEAPLEGVACAGGGGCVLVGEVTTPISQTNVETQTFAGLWSGGSLITEPTVNERETLAGELNAVACTGAGACEAVGDDEAGLTAFGQTGGSWTAQPVVQTPSPYLGSLSAVACVSSTDCVAAGFELNSSGSTQSTLIETWNGANWAMQSAPSPPLVASELTSVSCASASACVAVGWKRARKPGDSVPIAEVWNGSRWTLQTPPAPTRTASSQLLGVDCTSSSSCMAVGSARASDSVPYDYTTLVEAWDGTRWSTETSPNVGGVEDSYLNGISCASTISCVAVGSDDNDNGSQLEPDNAPLAESWNGVSWTIQPTPSLLPGSQFTSVSCVSSITCSAIGDIDFGSLGPDAPIAGALNGSTWTLDAIGSPAAGLLSSVSCVAADDCVAVGTDATAEAWPIPLAETGT